jgi:hypothetical protein
VTPIRPPSAAGIGDGNVPDVPPGDPARWLPCVMCRHLQIEHARDLRACDVQLNPRDPATRCDCSGFRERPPSPWKRR